MTTLRVISFVTDSYQRRAVIKAFYQIESFFAKDSLECSDLSESRQFDLAGRTLSACGGLRMTKAATKIRGTISRLGELENVFVET